MEPLDQGIYDVPASVYHSDPCPEPSLSNSIAKLICLSSPLHAQHQHPRLNPQHTQTEAENLDVGTAAHAVLLEGEAAVTVVDANDWRTNAAKDARDGARLKGKIPLLAKKWADVQAMVKSARAQLDRHRDGRAMFKNGKPEQTLIWREENGVWCRARLDWLRDDAIDDFKTTAGSADPDDWTRRPLFEMGFDMQVAWYLRGLKALTGYDGTFRFAVQETCPPYALSVITLGPDALLLAEKKCLYAIEKWRDGLDKKVWPGYAPQTCYATLPPWHESWWLEKELR